VYKEGAQSTASVSVVVYPTLSGLSVEKVSITPERPVDGETVNFEAVFHSTQNWTMYNATIRVYLDEELIYSTDLTHISAHSVFTKNFTWLARAGEYTLKVVASSEGGEGNFTMPVVVREKRVEGSPGFEAAAALIILSIFAIIGTVGGEGGNLSICHAVFPDTAASTGGLTSEMNEINKYLYPFRCGMNDDYRIYHPSPQTTGGDALQRFLEEDIGYGDISSMALPVDRTGEGRLFTKENCVLAGLEEAASVFGLLGIPALPLHRDGEKIQAGKTVLRVRGALRGILAGERLALNILSRMSGIATLTHSLVTRTRELNPDIRIACTRKTTPGFRFFEKKAVISGGGDPHRFRLDDAIMLKDNHLKALGDIKEGVKRAKSLSFTKKVEVEAETIEQALKAAEAGADIVMLDNMSPIEARACYNALKGAHPHIIVEVSGGITPENILDYAESADVISLGYLTHSYRSVDFSLELE